MPAAGRSAAGHRARGCDESAALPASDARASGESTGLADRRRAPISRLGSERCATRSAGATSCSTSPSRRSSGGSPSSAAVATCAAAESVCGTDGLSTLSTLVQHSLVETRWNELGDTRYELLETIAEFARERLEESREADELAERHAEYFAVYAETVEPSLYSDARAPWLVRLSDDRDNFRAALAWSVDHDDAAVGLRILAAFWLWWWTVVQRGTGLGRARPQPAQCCRTDVDRARARCSRPRSVRPARRHGRHSGVREAGRCSQPDTWRRQAARSCAGPRSRRTRRMEPGQRRSGRRQCSACSRAEH